ncbi:hypothetical protein [Shimia sagamensis]|uniref:Uncharacterized protein n=1 Tax=Shimia sagamensis TaxID=1566352 RepID=A0ABY1NM12_9RHOB|nr:hypothetical protein [Shimia sagamensis]SMP12293.1 hypothetical protein SAMN06265373_102331 [Shimia sagamensis]
MRQIQAYPIPDKKQLIEPIQGQFRFPMLVHHYSKQQNFSVEGTEETTFPLLLEPPSGFSLKDSFHRSASGWLLPSDNHCWARSRCKHVAAAPQGRFEPILLKNSLAKKRRDKLEQVF